MENLFTTKQVQDLFKVDRITIYRMVQDGRLKGVKVGNQWRFPQSEVERLLGGESAVFETEPVESVFPTHCVQTIQNLFTSVSQVSALVIDAAGKPVTQISEPCRFCQLVQSSPSGKNACQSSWESFMRQPNRQQRFTCHAGLNYLGATVVDQNRLQGQFLAGEFYWEQPDSKEEQQRVQQLALRHNLNVDELIEAAQSIPGLSEEQRSHLSAQPAAAARAIESILSERTNFLNRLQQIASLTQNL